VFVELMPMLKARTLLITVARVEEKVKVNVIPTKAKERGGAGSDNSSELHRDTRRVGCRTGQASRQLCRLPRATRQHSRGSEGGNGCGGEGGSAKSEGNSADLEA
jgi:hypothetical protein